MRSGFTVVLEILKKFKKINFKNIKKDDLGKELIPLIKTYFESAEFKTKKPGKNVEDPNKLHFEMNTDKIIQNMHGAYNLIKKIHSKNDSNIILLTPMELNLQFDIRIFNKGHHFIKENEMNKNDIWLFQIEGESKIKLKTGLGVEQRLILKEKDSTLIPADYCMHLETILENETDFTLLFKQKSTV